MPLPLTLTCAGAVSGDGWQVASLARASDATRSPQELADRLRTSRAAWDSFERGELAALTAKFDQIHKRVTPYLGSAIPRDLAAAHHSAHKEAELVLSAATAAKRDWWLAEVDAVGHLIRWLYPLATKAVIDASDEAQPVRLLSAAGRDLGLSGAESRDLLVALAALLGERPLMFRATRTVVLD